MGAGRERVEMNHGVTKPPQNGAGGNTANGDAVQVNFRTANPIFGIAGETFYLRC